MAFSTLAIALSALAIAFPTVSAVALPAGPEVTAINAVEDGISHLEARDPAFKFLPPMARIRAVTFKPSNGVYNGVPLTAGAPVPSGVWNPNGPIYNPHDYTPQPFIWPGKPTAKNQKPPPRPTVAPYQKGGPYASKYSGPAWLPKTALGNGLKPVLGQQDTNGNSPWGMLNLPPLPWYGAAGKPPALPPKGGRPTTTTKIYGAGPPAFTFPGMPTNFPGFPGLPGFQLPGFSGLPKIPGFPYPGFPGLPSRPTTTSKYTPSSYAPTRTPVPNNPFPNLTACDDMPDTGVTRKYDFTVGYQKIAPDGVVKNGITINGQFPGPLIEANWGDWIEVTVTNAIPDEGTALHWHGILQNGTSWYDGVPSVSQCPLAPGASMTYRYRADHIGTSWYHSHYSAQYAGGAFGPIVIQGPTTAQYDIDLGPILLSDWYHGDYFTLVNNTLNGIIPPSNNNLINGKMNYPCQNTTLPCTPNAGISKFQFQSGKKYRLRLINASAEGVQKFAIDGHTMTVIANDFIPIKNPYVAPVITLGVGQRADIIVEATGKAGDAVWMRSDLGTLGKGCSFTDGISTEAVAAIYYQGADTNAVPTTQSAITAEQLAFCGNDPIAQNQPFCEDEVQIVPDVSQNIDISFGSNGTNFVWFMNNQTFRGDYNDPVLGDVKAGNLTFPKEYNVFNFGTAPEIRLIVKNHFQFGSHPMHLHGHDFYVLAEGFGDWDGVITNPSNPLRRDVQLLHPAKDANTPSYMVIQWENDNPGAWPFHCHIAWHVSAGLYINVVERPEDVQKQVFPQDFADTCRSWDVYSGANPPNQIDSGL